MNLSETIHSLALRACIDKPRRRREYKPEAQASEFLYRFGECENISETIHSLALRVCIFGGGDGANTSPKRKRVNFFTSSEGADRTRPDAIKDRSSRCPSPQDCYCPYSGENEGQIFSRAGESYQ